MQSVRRLEGPALRSAGPGSTAKGHGRVWGCWVTTPNSAYGSLGSPDECAAGVEAD
jgi:hypothetical protein